MREVYKKKQLEIEYFNEGFKYWKRVQTSINGYGEKYKDKAAIFLQITNLLPEGFMAPRENSFYYAVLMKGDRLHKDLGRLYVDKTGYGKIYVKFAATELRVCDGVWLQFGDENVMKCRLPFHHRDSSANNKLESSDDNKPKSPWEVIFEEGCKGKEVNLFSSEADETRATWHIVAFDANKYKHMAIGTGPSGDRYIALPGRFLIDEVPSINEELLTLWQPLRGGEEFFDRAEEMDETLARSIYGYWICKLMEDGSIKNL